MSDFAAQFERFAKKVDASLDETCSAIKIVLFNSIVDDTRVRTGRLRGNWQIQDDTPPSGELDRKDVTGSTVKGEVASEVTPISKTYFVNNLPYAEVMEQKDGMVSRNVARIRKIISDIAGKAK